MGPEVDYSDSIGFSVCTANIGIVEKYEGVGEDPLAKRVHSLEGNDRVKFLAFLRRMLNWMPEDRAAVAELLSDPWLEETDEESNIENRP
jgi:hypothetical protein